MLVIILPVDVSAKHTERNILSLKHQQNAGGSLHPSAEE